MNEIPREGAIDDTAQGMSGAEEKILEALKVLQAFIQQTGNKEAEAALRALVGTIAGGQGPVGKKPEGQMDEMNQAAMAQNEKDMAMSKMTRGRQIPNNARSGAVPI